MKKYLFTGIIILLPIALTLLLLIWLINFLTAPFVGFVDNLINGYQTFLGIDLHRHETLILIFSRIFILIFLTLGILVLGFIGNRFFFRSLINALGKIFLK